MDRILDPSLNPLSVNWEHIYERDLGLFHLCEHGKQLSFMEQHYTKHVHTEQGQRVPISGHIWMAWYRSKGHSFDCIDAQKLVLVNSDQKSVNYNHNYI